jgi:hypothetical protein
LGLFDFESPHARPAEPSLRVSIGAHRPTTTTHYLGQVPFGDIDLRLDDLPFARFRHIDWMIRMLRDADLLTKRDHLFGGPAVLCQDPERCNDSRGNDMLGNPNSALPALCTHGTIISGSGA